MKSTQKYILTGPKQVIDLNGDLTNFDLTFTVASSDGSDFEAVVVDQNTLDNNPAPEYKSAPGSISGNIIADKGVYQNYFLLLRCSSDKDVECEVTIEKKEIPVNPLYVPAPGTAPPSLTKENFERPSKTQGSNKPKIDFKLILKVLLVVAVIGFIYFKFFKKTSSNVETDNGSTIKSSSIEDVSDTLITKPVLPPAIPTAPFDLPVHMPVREEYKPNLTIKIPKLVSPSHYTAVNNDSVSRSSSKSTSVRSSVNRLENTISDVAVTGTQTSNPISDVPLPSSINQNLFKRLNNLNLK